MNRYFFSAEEQEQKMKLTEVGLIMKFMEETFNQEDEVKKNKLKMFLDIHSHSA